MTVKLPKPTTPFFVLTCLLISGALAGILYAHSTTENAAVEVEQLIKSTHSWDGNLLPPYQEGQPEITILHITIPPQTKLPMHKHPMINVGVLLSGQLVVTDDEGNQLHLRAGDPIIELVNRWHYGKNPSDQPAEIIVFYAGTEGEPVTILHPEELADTSH